MTRAVIRELDPDSFGEGDEPKDERWWAPIREKALAPYRAIIRDWVKECASRGWGGSTPSYVLSGACFDLMLNDKKDDGSSVRVVLDQGRYNEMRYPFAIPLFANIGKNKITPNEEAIKDYENLVVKFNEICDCFVINVSSPNTPNLRELQEESFIKEFFACLLPIAKKPIIFKIAPDMAESKAVQICKTAVESGAKGVIVNNTKNIFRLLINTKFFLIAVPSVPSALIP